MENILDILDYTEFRLGMICTTLTFIEWCTPYAKRIEKFIDNMESILHDAGDSYTSGMFYQILFTISVPALVFLLFTHIADASPTFDINWNSWLILLARIIVYTTYSFLSLYLLSWLIQFCNKYFRNQALAGIGFILGTIASILGIIDKILDN